jgi:hypothetical protein
VVSNSSHRPLIGKGAIKTWRTILEVKNRYMGRRLRRAVDVEHGCAVCGEKEAAEWSWRSEDELVVIMGG